MEPACGARKRGRKASSVLWTKEGNGRRMQVATGDKPSRPFFLYTKPGGIKSIGNSVAAVERLGVALSFFGYERPRA
jgi:hypothetical protein